MTFPTVRPARRVHVPAVPSGQLPDPGGATPAERAHRAQQQTADLYTRWRDSFPDGIDPDELRDNAGEFSVSDAALGLQRPLDAVKDDADAAAKRVSDLVKDTRVGDDVSNQLAAQRYWARGQRGLDAAKDPANTVAAAQSLINSADNAQIPVLVEELGDYLTSRNIPTGWLIDALTSRIPGLADAAADAAVKAKQHAILLQNHNVLMNAFAKDVAAPQLIDPAIATAQPYGG
jgi:hypothetical protein